MHPVHARQLKAARAMLGWSREDLADATGLSLTTIRSVEAGTISPRHATNHAIRQAIEDNGLEFTEHEGIRCRPRDVLIFQGHDGPDRLFEDILQTLKRNGGTLHAVCPKAPMLTLSIGASQPDLHRLEQLSAVASLKCLLSDCSEPLLASSTIQFRAISKLHASPTPYFIYGDKLAFVLRESRADLRFVVLQSLAIAHHWTDHFSELWDTGVPFLTRANSPAPQSPENDECSDTAPPGADHPVTAPVNSRLRRNKCRKR